MSPLIVHGWIKTQLMCSEIVLSFLRKSPSGPFCIVLLSTSSISLLYGFSPSQISGGILQNLLMLLSNQIFELD